MSDAPESGAARPVSLPLHRVRFVDWTPSSITALAFSPVPPAAQARCVLAVGRENGNIDLCTWCEDTSADASAGAPLARGWMIEHTLFGDVNYKIEALAFTRAHVDGAEVLRLFSTSGGSVVTEHFLPPHMALVGEDVRAKPRVSHTSPTRTLPSHGGAIWSMAASPLGHYLAIGCEDGIVRLVDVRGDAFEHVHGARPGMPGAVVAPRMSRVASRILSLAWGPPRRVVRQAANRAPTAHDDDSSSDDDSASEDEDEEWRESFLLGGLGNSSAAVWDVATGQLRSRLALLKNRSEHTIVWSVAVLSDGTLVTGDSTGRVTFFDARSRVPIPGATFQCHTSGADVLALCIGSDGRAVYSAGVDQKVAEYTLVGHTWAHTATRRLHAHDIRALAVDPPFDPRGASTAPTRLPVLVSGGIDFHLVLTPAAPAQRTTYANPISSSVSTRFADTTQRRVPFVPQNARAPIAGGAVLSVCAARRWLVLRRDTSVAIWALGAHDDAPWYKVSELQLKTRSNLIAAAVSPDGRYLAASDLYETKLFALTERDGVLTPRRVRTLGAAIHGTDAPAPGASVLTFTPDSTRLVLGTLHGAYVHVVQLSHAGEVQLLRSFTQHRQRHTPDDGRHGRVLAGDARVRGKAAHADDTARDVYATLVLAHVSPDGQWLVSVDSVRRMHVFHLDTLSHQRVLASPASLPTAACFHPERPHVLVVTLPTNQLALYDMDAGAPAGAWERELRAQFDTHLAKVREPVVGCAWLPGVARQEATLVLYGPTWITSARHTSTPPAPAGTKRRGTAPGDAGAGWVVRSTFKYQPLLAVHAFPQDTATELLVVERPYFALAQSLPPSFYRGAKYGF